MASLHTITPHSLLPLSKSKRFPSKTLPNSHFLGNNKFSHSPILSRNKQKRESWLLNSVFHEDLDVIPVQSGDCIDHQEGVVVSPVESEGNELATQVSGFGPNEGQLSLEGFSSASTSGDGLSNQREMEMDKLIDRTINGLIVLAAGSYTVSKLLTIDHDYWQGWTIFEILRYAPQHNWYAYEEALKTNPVLAKMMISGAVYSIGDWIAQCFEGKPLFEFDRARMFRSGLVGFTLHGSLSHYYYQFWEELIPYQDWWVVFVKMAIDQTAWAAIWNSIYLVAVGFLRLESPVSMFNELRATFWPMLKAGWKLWPFAHLVTYGLIPLEQRLLWVDCVELIWVTILSTFSNEKSEARILETPEESSSNSLSKGPLEE